jgi:hypothetical protein
MALIVVIALSLWVGMQIERARASRRKVVSAPYYTVMRPVRQTKGYTVSRPVRWVRSAPTRP